MTSSSTAADAAPERRPKAAVLKTSATADALDLAASIERSLNAELEGLSVVELSTTTPLTFSELQFAVGCTDATESCLAEVAAMLGVDVLVLSSVARTETGVTLDLAVFRASDHLTQQTTREFSGPGADSETLDALEPALRELFGLPIPQSQPAQPAAADPIAPHEAASATADRMAPVPSDEATALSRPTATPLLPWILAGTGVLAIGTGAVFGMLANNSEDEFKSAPVGDRAEIDAAHGVLQDARTQATLANVFLGAGAAMIVTAGVLLLLDGAPATSASIAIEPSVGLDRAGVLLGGRFGATR
jgi:hypothetical protein